MHLLFLLIFQDDAIYKDCDDKLSVKKDHQRIQIFFIQRGTGSLAL